MSNLQFLRKAGLIVSEGKNFQTEFELGPFDRRGVDLSNMKFKFDIMNADTQSPNNAAIRVYNLSSKTVQRLRSFVDPQVSLQAGYESNMSVIFTGAIKQFQFGKENATDTFLDILAADGDLGFNYGVLNQSMAAGGTLPEVMKKASAAMGLPIERLPDFTGTNVARLSRGKVLYGMARDLMRDATASMNSTWSIQDGKVVVIEKQGYLPGEAVVLNAATGMIGIPRQTDQGIYVRCLINPKIRIGGLIKLDNKTINQLVQTDGKEYGVSFNSWAGITYASKISEESDGLYRAYVVEHHGDTRGKEWYSDLVLLAIAPATNTVAAKQ